MERVAYIVPLILYGVLAFVHLLPGVLRPVERNLRAIGGISVTVHAFALGVQLQSNPHDPGLPEALSALSFGVMIAWLLTASGGMRAIGLALTPLGAVALGVAMVVPDLRVRALSDAGPSAWLPVHLGLIFAGVAGFALSSGVGVLYLIARRRLKTRDTGGVLGRLPPLEWLDRLQFRAMLFGFVFLTLGIVAGGAWAAATLHQPWALDAKVLFTVVLWLWYGVALQARLIGGMRGRWSALFSIVGFVGMVFSMVALNLASSGWHGYGR